jgi:dihydrofolate synthase / folylpolyglutamate synthase
VTSLAGLGYAAVIEALEERGRFGIRLGLGRTRALLRALGDPHLGLPGALIGGTNGKGSVQALVAAALRSAGYRVGQTPKPHLVSYRERVAVDGRPIEVDAFVALLTETLDVAERIGRRSGRPTEFEVLTAAALAYFRAAGVDVAVIEVGLGGRLDATNAWDGGVAAITNVSRDHMERLGHTITAIAREKAAIIKRGDLAVTGADGAALDLIRRRARRLGVPLTAVDPLPVVAMDRTGLLMRHERLGELRLRLLGRHQAANAAVALAVVDALAQRGIARVDDEHVRAGFADARWPGRLELLRVESTGRAVYAGGSLPDPGAPDLLLDGAHNAAGMAALASALDELGPSLSGGRRTVLMAVVAEKEVARMVESLARSSALSRATVIATTVPDTTRSLAASELGAVWQTVGGAHAGPAIDDAGSTAGGRELSVVTDPERALDLGLRESARAGGPLIVCGSLYLVGHVRGRLVDDPALRDPLA